MEKDSHLLELCRYIVLNPVDAGIVDTPDQFQWSSYNTTTLNQKGQEFLTIHWLLRQFSNDAIIARKRYKDFVQDGMAEQESPWAKLKGQIFLGSKKFISRMQAIIDDQNEIQEIPKTQRLASRPALGELLAHDMNKPQRNSAITEAHIRYDYTLKEIGDYLDIHYSTVSRAVKTTKDRM